MTSMALAEREAELARIEAEVAEVAGLLNAAHGRLVGLAGELIETGLWRGYGIKSVEHWLCWHAGLSPQRARQVVAVAGRRAELPVTVDTLTRGELSLDQVGEVARFVPAHNDADAAELAKVATVVQLRGTLSRYRFDDVTRTDPTQPADKKAAAGATADGTPADDPAVRRGTAAVVHDGHRFGLHVDAPLDDGALIEQALLEAKDALFRAGRPDVGWLDALREVCQRSLSGVKSAGRRDRYRVYVHLDTNSGWLNQGPALPETLLTKLCCDGVIQPLWQTDGAPVNVGRTQRIVPDRTRRLVEDRDRCCIVPGCGSRYHLEVHHLIPWSQGGATDTANLACLCPFHHDALHRGELTIAGNADDPASLRFLDARDRPMPGLVPATPPVTLPGPQSGTGDDGDTTHRPTPVYRHPSGERINRRWVYLNGRPPAEESAAASQPNAPPT